MSETDSDTLTGFPTLWRSRSDETLLNDKNSQKILNQVVDISSAFCLWGAVSSILTLPDGMGGIDPIQLEMTGTLMLRGVW